MRNRSAITVATAVALSFSLIALSGCNTQTRNTTPNRTGITQQGGNVSYNGNRNNRVIFDNDRTGNLLTTDRNDNILNNGRNNLLNTDRNNFATDNGRLNNLTGVDRNDNIAGKNANDIDNNAVRLNMPTDGQKAKNIETMLKSMNEIQDANAVVAGNTCIVGVNSKNNATNTDALKNMIIERIKASDPSITNVIVSQTGDVIEKIRQISSDIANNRPMDKINNDIAQLIRQAMPAAR